LFVVEGDESDGTLALYHPEHAIVLNIEEEHLDYYENLAAIEAVFQQVLAQTRGHVFYCADDPTRRDSASRIRARFPTANATSRSIASTMCTRRIFSRTSACCAAVKRSAPSR
jgi:UDP-N-acetylmuramate-alanine ligase